MFEMEEKDYKSLSKNKIEDKSEAKTSRELYMSKSG